MTSGKFVAYVALGIFGMFVLMLCIALSQLSGAIHT